MGPDDAAEGGEVKGRLSHHQHPTNCQFQMLAKEQKDYFKRLRDFYDQQVLCDVVLRVGGRDFKCHKSVLAGHQCFLGSLMTCGMKEENQSTIELELGDDADPALFSVILDYMYGKQVQIDHSEVVNLLGLASRFQVSGLLEQACAALAGALDATNCAAIFAAADHFHCTALRQRAFQKIVTSFAVVCKTDGFKELDYRLLLMVVESDQILDCDESLVFEAAVRWVGHKEDERKQHVQNIIDHVRFPLMDAGYLSDVIKVHPFLNFPEASTLLMEAFEHQALVACGRTGAKAGTSSRRTLPRCRSCSFKNATLLQEHNDAVSALCTVNGILVSGSWDTTIKVWSPSNWQCERTLSDHTGTIRALATCQQRLVSASDDACIKVWNSETWTLVRTLSDHTDGVNAVVQCQGRLVSGSDDGTIKLWNATTWICEVTLHQREEQQSGVLSLAVVGDKLASGSDHAFIKIWNTSNWTCERSFQAHEDQVWAMAVCQGHLVSASVDGTIKVWEAPRPRADSSRREDSRNRRAHQSPAHMANNSTEGSNTRDVDGSTGGGEEATSAMDMEGGSEGNMGDSRNTDGEQGPGAESGEEEEEEGWECIEVLTEHGGPVYALVVQRGKLVSASNDETIKVWDMQWRCERTQSCPGVWALAVYKNRLVSGSSDNAIKIWI